MVMEEVLLAIIFPNYCQLFLSFLAINAIADHRNTSTDHDEILYRESSDQMKISTARIYDQ